MRVNANNSINFKCKDCATNIQELSYAKFPEQKRENIDTFMDDVKRTSKNVSPITCIIATLAGVAAWKKGSQAIALTRSIIAKGGEEITNGALSLASKIKKFDTTKTKNATHKFFGHFMGTSEINNKKITNKITNIVDAIYSKEIINEKGKKITTGKAENIIASLNKLGLYFNAKSLFDSAFGLITGIGTMNVVSDVIEEHIDKRDIQKSALKNIKTYSEVANTIIQSLNT